MCSTKTIVQNIKEDRCAWPNVPHLTLLQVWSLKHFQNRNSSMNKLALKGEKKLTFSSVNERRVIISKRTQMSSSLLQICQVMHVRVIQRFHDLFVILNYNGAKWGSFFSPALLSCLCTHRQQRYNWGRHFVAAQQMATWRTPSRFSALPVYFLEYGLLLPVFIPFNHWLHFKDRRADIGRTFHFHSVNLIHLHCNRCHIPVWRTGWIAAAEKDSNMFLSLCWGWVTVCIMRLFSLTPPPNSPTTATSSTVNFESGFEILHITTLTTDISNPHMTVMDQVQAHG